MNASKSVFQKRTYTIRGFIDDATHVMRDILRAPSTGDESGALDRAFSERIMLAVTQVNDCRYCDYGHSLAALRAGVTREELEAIKDGDFSAASEDELPALLFAQHYASEGGQPEDEAHEALIRAYGETKAARILLTIRMITIGNLLGNTFDALLSRLRGRAVLSGSAFEEIAVLLLVLLAAPFMLIAGLAGLLMRLVSRAVPV